MRSQIYEDQSEIIDETLPHEYLMIEIASELNRLLARCIASSPNEPITNLEVRWLKIYPVGNPHKQEARFKLFARRGPPISLSELSKISNELAEHEAKL